MLHFAHAQFSTPETILALPDPGDAIPYVKAIWLYTRGVALAARGDFAGARRIHNRFLDLMNLNFVESNPIPVKASLALLGLCEESFRLPLCPPKSETREALKAALKALGLLA